MAIPRNSPLLPVHSSRSRRRGGSSFVKFFVVICVVVGLGLMFVGIPKFITSGATQSKSKDHSLKGAASNAVEFAELQTAQARNLQVETKINEQVIDLDLPTADEAAMSKDQESDLPAVDFLHVSGGEHRTGQGPVVTSHGAHIVQQQDVQKAVPLVLQQHAVPVTADAIVEDSTVSPTTTEKQLNADVAAQAAKLEGGTPVNVETPAVTVEPSPKGDVLPQADKEKSEHVPASTVLDQDALDGVQATHVAEPLISPSPAATGLYALSAVDIEGNLQQLSKYAGKVTLVVNVASACGYTDENYKGLTTTYGKYKKYGFEVLGFPCNQFGNQESGSESEIKSFCSSKYHVEFPMFSKVEVNGPNTHPVYQFLKKELPESEGGGGGKGPGKDLVWNFNKFIVNKQGYPVKFFYQNYDVGAVESTVYKLLHEGTS